VVDLRPRRRHWPRRGLALKRQRPDARAIVLTGYGNIATAVTAVKMGAVDYLSKPAMPTMWWRRCLPAAREVRNCRIIDVGGPGALGAHPAHLRDVNRNVSETRGG